MTDNLKVFEVTSNWKTFRIPVKKDELTAAYLNLHEWLEENCDGVWKIFEITCGNKGNSSYSDGQYGILIQIDLLSDIDIVAFKLRWG